MSEPTTGAIEAGVNAWLDDNWNPDLSLREWREILVEGPKFVLERWNGGKRDITLPKGTPGWLVPIRGEGVVGGVAWRAGECVMVEGPELLHASDDADLLFAYTGTTRL